MQHNRSFHIGAILSIGLLLALVWSVAFPQSALANINVQWDAATGTLTVTSDGDDNIVITGETSDPEHPAVLINGNMYILPHFGTVNPRDVKRLIVNGGPGNNFIDLSGIDYPQFLFVWSIEVYAGAGNDLIIGGKLGEHIEGGEGNDRIEQRDHNAPTFAIDELYGGPGDDFIDGGNGTNHLYGGEGNDEMYGGEDGNYMDGGDGNDRIYGGINKDEIHGGSGADEIDAGDGDDVIFGGDGDDLVQGGDGNDIMDGNQGNDVLSGGPGDDSIMDHHGEEGETNHLFGGDGNDTLLGGSGNDMLWGGPGNDEMYSGGGHNVLNGDEGDDTIEGAGDDDTIDGGPGNDMIRGSDGFLHYLEKPGSADIIDDSANDSSGESTLDFSEAASAITIDMDLQNVNQVVDANGNTVQLQGRIEHFVGSVFSDTVSVGPLNVPRTITGGGGNDTLNFDAKGLPATDNGTTITVPGYAPVTYAGFRTVNIIWHLHLPLILR